MFHTSSVWPLKGETTHTLAMNSYPQALDPAHLYPKVTSCFSHPLGAGPPYTAPNDPNASSMGAHIHVQKILDLRSSKLQTRCP